VARIWQSVDGMEPMEREGQANGMPPPSSRRVEGGNRTGSRAADAALRTVDRTEAIPAFFLRAHGHRATGLARLARQVWSLPTFSRMYAAHQNAIDLLSNDALVRTLRRLEGKFIVANRRCAVSVPRGLRRLAFDPQALGDIVADARWLAFALHEPMAVVVHHASFAGAHLEDASREAEFFATIPYRLTVFAGRGPFENANYAVDEAAALAPVAQVTEPCEWFHVGLCIPDVDALRQMAGDTALFYRWVTGRLGSASRDQYWHLDEWEQYTEHGRVHGVVLPELIRQQRLSAPSSPLAAHAADADGFAQADGTYGASRWPTFTRTFDRRALVPPGYCFIEFTATLTVEVRHLSDA